MAAGLILPLLEISIRPARLEDIDTIVSFNLALAFESERIQLEPEVLHQGVEALLRDPGKGFYLIAECAGQSVGQTMVTFEWSDWRNKNWWWLQSVYVAPSSRRRGVFRALYDQVESRAAREGASGLRLYVEQENRDAQSTYSALGMRPGRYHLYERGDA